MNNRKDEDHREPGCMTVAAALIMFVIVAVPLMGYVADFWKHIFTLVCDQLNR